MELPEIKLDPAGADPDIEIKIGQAQFGQYTVDRRDTAGTELRINKGDNVDDEEDKFSLEETAENLKDQILIVDLIIRALTDDPNELYSAEVVVTQDNQPVKGGTFRYDEKLDELRNILVVARFSHK